MASQVRLQEDDWRKRERVPVGIKARPLQVISNWNLSEVISLCPKSRADIAFRRKLYKPSQRSRAIYLDLAADSTRTTTISRCRRPKARDGSILFGNSLSYQTHRRPFGRVCLRQFGRPGGGGASAVRRFEESRKVLGKLLFPSWVPDGSSASIRFRLKPP